MLYLPDVTLCAATCVNVPATIEAMERCLAVARFGRVLLFTDDKSDRPTAGVERIAIRPLTSSRDYSRFVLQDMVDWVETSHCLIVQWDGFILNAESWSADFLDCDYIGAPWPQFRDGHDVGNGGFSLRSRRLMEACRDPRFIDTGQAEDVVIGRANRSWLEQELDLRFADRALASRFSFERDRTVAAPFGFHGVFNLPEAIGADEFWHLYRGLDDTGTVWIDFAPLLRTILRGPDGLRRAALFILDRLSRSFRRGVPPFGQQ